jgi:hypothetical protein
MMKDFLYCLKEGDEYRSCKGSPAPQEAASVIQCDGTILDRVLDERGWPLVRRHLTLKEMARLEAMELAGVFS